MTTRPITVRDGPQRTHIEWHPATCTCTCPPCLDHELKRRAKLDGPTEVAKMLQSCERTT